jgi:hypothetical protein
MYLDLSSTSSKKWRLPPGVAGEMGLQRSPWTKSSNPSDLYFAAAGNVVRRCFVATQLVHLLDDREPAHHVVTGEFAKRVEVKVPVPLDAITNAVL